MVFSFFRKDKEPEDEGKKVRPRPPATQPARPATQASPPPAQPAPSQPAADAIAAPPQTETFGMAGGIEVVESCSGSDSAIEEAAIYFANNRVDQAVAALVRCLKEHAHMKELQPWLMLFDLYQISGRKQHFDELAMEFVVKFERSPPAWHGGDQAEAQQAPQKSGPGNYFAFTGALTSASEGQFKQLQAAAKGGAVRLDLSKIQSVDADGSRLLLNALQDMRKAGVKVQYSGVATLSSLLKQAIEAGAESDTAHWLLMLELCLLQGKQEEFEDLAVEYAVTFEVSPPSWEQMVGRIQAEEVSEPATTAAEEQPQPQGFVLEGVVSAESEAKLKELVKYAEGRKEVHIDMSRVIRVDFVSVGGFLGVMIEISQDGRKIFIKGANEMIFALFGVMGVNQFATIVRKTKY